MFYGFFYNIINISHKKFKIIYIDLAARIKNICKIIFRIEK